MVWFGATNVAAASTINIAPTGPFVTSNGSLYLDSGLTGSAPLTVNATTAGFGLVLRFANDTYSGTMSVNGFASPTPGVGSGLVVGDNAGTSLTVMPNANLTINGTLDMGNETTGMGWAAGSGSGQTFTMNGLSGTGVVVGNFAATSTRTLSVGNNNGSGSFSGGIYNGDNDTLSFVKNGTGTQTLSGPNYYTGSTTVTAGTLALTPLYTTPVINSVTNSSALTLGEASLTMTGPAGFNAFQQFFSTTFSAGTGSSISATPGSGGNYEVTLGALSRGAGSTVNFTIPTGTQTATTNGIITTTNDPAGTGILGGWATVGGNWAVSGATAGTTVTPFWSTTTNQITFSASQTVGNEVEFGGTAPTGLAINTPYYILTTGTLSAVSAIKGGPAIALSGTPATGATYTAAGNITAYSGYTTLPIGGGGTQTSTNFSLASSLGGPVTWAPAARSRRTR